MVVRGDYVSDCFGELGGGDAEEQPNTERGWQPGSVGLDGGGSNGAQVDVAEMRWAKTKSRSGVKGERDDEVNEEKGEDW